MPFQQLLANMKRWTGDRGIKDWWSPKKRDRAHTNSSPNPAPPCLPSPPGTPPSPAPWTALGAPNYPWYPQARRFTADGYADWSRVMGEVATALATLDG